MGWGRKVAIGTTGLIGIGAIAFFAFAPGIVESGMNRIEPTAAVISERAKGLHNNLFVADLHSDTLMWKRDLTDPADRGHMDLDRLLAGNIGLQVFSSVTKTPKDQNYDSNSADGDNITLLTVAQLQPPRTWTSLLERSLWHSQKLQAAARQTSKLKLVKTKSDLEKVIGDTATTTRSVGALLSIEGLQNLEGKRENLDVLFKAGFRMAGLAHFFDNEVSGSMHGEKKGGLTPLGRQIVQDMEAKGMVVDIAHASHTAVAEILAMATKPVVSSHGGVQATCKVNRNLTDVEILGVAKTGGVIGIGYWDGAICSTKPADIARAMKHVRDLVGIDHVGLGSDYDGATTVGFDTAGVAHVTQALMDAGFTDNEIAKVMGGNVQRVLMAVLPAR